MYKKTNAIMKIFAVCIIILSGFTFFSYTVRGRQSLEWLREPTGVILAVTLGLALGLFIILKIFSYSKKWPKLKPLIQFFSRLLASCHRSFGLLAFSFLLFHFSLSAELNNLLSFRQISGCVTACLIIITITLAIFYKIKKQEIKKMHILIAYIAVIPFLVHLI